MITLSPTKRETYLQLRSRRYSHAVLKYDPGHPILSIQQEEEFWKNEVAKGQHMIWDIIFKKSATIGFVHAFNFNDNTCETGISILFQKYRKKGYGYEAYRILFEILRQMSISTTFIWTTALNISAIALYRKLGFTLAETQTDNDLTWVKYMRCL
ncbi:MAG: GNAT family N-acetyltransferase [candidate division WOR-3 bacterium]|nr:MAG: GNAT family N-acetyltransferase [candidate division WOR-3 bacterium]